MSDGGDAATDDDDALNDRHLDDDRDEGCRVGARAASVSRAAKSATDMMPFGPSVPPIMSQKNCERSAGARRAQTDLAIQDAPEGGPQGVWRSQRPGCKCANAARPSSGRRPRKLVRENTSARTCTRGQHDQAAEVVKDEATHRRGEESAGASSAAPSQSSRSSSVSARPLRGSGEASEDSARRARDPFGDGEWWCSRPATGRTARNR